jgi:hypothetical protein
MTELDYYAWMAMKQTKSKITVEDVELFVSTYVMIHGPIESQESLIHLLNWVEDYKAIPKDPRSKQIRIKRAIHGNRRSIRKET